MAELSAELIQQLARSRGDDSSFISLYLNVDGRENIRPEDYQSQLDALIKDCLTGENPPDVINNLERIRKYIANEFERGNTRGIALFVHGEDFWELVELPVAVQNRLIVNMGPHLRDLEVILEGHQSVGVFVVDKQHAKLLIIEFGRVVERDEVIDPIPRHNDDKGDWRKDHVKTHVNAAVGQHFRRAAQAMFELYQKHPFAHLVVGVADELRGEVERELHAYLRARLIGICNMSVVSSDDEIIANVKNFAEAAEREKESKFVDKLRAAVLANDAAGRTNGKSIGGVAGIDNTLKAVFEKRVDTLLISEGFTAEGWRCKECSYIATLGRSCAMCGEQMMLVEDVVEEAVEDALSQKCKVEFCSASADLDVLGQIGALLRY